MGGGVDPFVLAAAALVGLGLYGFAVQSHPLIRVLALKVLGNGAFLGLIVVAQRLPGTPDPVPHAMVLTGIVIAVSAAALALALVRRLFAGEAEEDPEDEGQAE